MTPVVVAFGAGGGFSLPGTRRLGISSCSRILAGEEGWITVDRWRLHWKGIDGDWDGLVPLVIGVLVVVGKVDGCTNDETT